MPLTSIYGIVGTSYGLQLGEKNDRLVSVIYKGKEVMAIKLVGSHGLLFGLTKTLLNLQLFFLHSFFFSPHS